MTIFAVDRMLECAVERTVRARSVYDVETLSALYAEDQTALVLDVDGTVSRLSCEEMLAAFDARRKWGEVPAPDTYRVLHIEQQGSGAVALLCRWMGLEEPALLLELRLRRYARGWRVTGETVCPWPGHAPAREAFLALGAAGA